MMSRQDYELLAAAFKTTFDALPEDRAQRAIRRAVEQVANVLAVDNPRFDRLLFYNAAGVGQKSAVYQAAKRNAAVNVRPR